MTEGVELRTFGSYRFPDTDTGQEQQELAMKQNVEVDEVRPLDSSRR